MPYDAFISYSTLRPEHADTIGAILKKGKYRYFRDKHSINDGGDWHAEIVQALKESTVLLVLVTPDAEKSDGVKEEITLATEMCIPRLPLIMEKYEHISAPLRALRLDDKQAIDIARDGLESARIRLLKFMKKETDMILKLKPSLDALEHFSPTTRLKAVGTLADSKNPIIIPQLLKAYAVEVADSPEAALYIFQRLGDFDDKRIIDMALEVYKNAPGDVLIQGQYRITAVDILGRWGAHDPNAIEWAFEQMEIFAGKVDDLCRILRNSDEATRVRTIEWLKMKIHTVDGYISYYVNGLRILGDPRELGFLKETIRRKNLTQIDEDALHRAIQEMTIKTT